MQTCNALSVHTSRDNTHSTANLNAWMTSASASARSEAPPREANSAKPHAEHSWCRSDLCYLSHLKSDARRRSLTYNSRHASCADPLAVPQPHCRHAERRQLPASYGDRCIKCNFLDAFVPSPRSSCQSVRCDCPCSNGAVSSDHAKCRSSAATVVLSFPSRAVQHPTGLHAGAI